MNLRRFCISVLFVASPSCARSGPLPSAPTAIEGFAHPESVATDAGARRFVSNVGAKLDPLARDGDGFVSELDPSGRVVELRAFAPLDAPKGMAVIAGKLYVADIDRVVAFEIATRKRLFEIRSPAAGQTLLNDVAVESDDVLLVTDTLAGALLRMRLAARTATIVATGISGANGVAVAGRTAYVVGIGGDFSGGYIHRVDLATGAVSRVGSAHGLFDGVAVAKDGILVSDWVSLEGRFAGVVALYAPTGEKRREVVLPSGARGPADFFFDATREQLWIPRMLDGKVSIVDAR
jgi:hypothetical protein